MEHVFLNESLSMFKNRRKFGSARNRNRTQNKYTLK